MDDVVPRHSVSSGFSRIRALMDEVYSALLQLGASCNVFSSFQDQIKLLHRGIFVILETISAPLHEFTALGLRVSEDQWQNPPLTTEIAIDDVRRMVVAMEPLLTPRNACRLVRGYQSLFGIEFDYALASLPSLNVGDHNEANNFSDLSVLGATPEEINGMPAHLAIGDDTRHECTICYETYVCGEQIKVLPCSHRFHKTCIDGWLANCATCPVDRSRVFGN